MSSFDFAGGFGVSIGRPGGFGGVNLGLDFDFLAIKKSHEINALNSCVNYLMGFWAKAEDIPKIGGRYTKDWTL